MGSCSCGAGGISSLSRTGTAARMSKRDVAAVPGVTGSLELLGRAAYAASGAVPGVTALSDTLGYIALVGSRPPGTGGRAGPEALWLLGTRS